MNQYEMDYVKKDFEEYMVEIRHKNIISVINKYKHSRILEVGCGTNMIFRKITNFSKYTIVEPSASFCDVAKANIKGENIEIINTTLENYYLSKQNVKHEFDLILLSSILHLIEDLDAFLFAIRNLSTKDTIIYLNVPNINSLHRIIALESGIINNISEKNNGKTGLYKKHFFDVPRMQKLLVNNGFTILNYGSYFLKPFSHEQMMRIIDDKVIDESVLDGLYKLSKYIPDYGAEIFFEVKIND